MVSERNRINLTSKFKPFAVFCLFFAGVSCGFTTSSPAEEISNPVVPQNSEYFTLERKALDDGKMVDLVIINGPPAPPPGFEIERLSVRLPEPVSPSAIKSLSVPAYSWVFGCSSVSAAMIAAYYDRTNYPNIYTGPTNGGVMPMNNSTTYWPTWSDGDLTYPSLPLAASMRGIDGRMSRGSIDNYWVQYNSSANDPYITNGWSQHGWGTAIGDYMKTSQSAHSNSDGSTSFYSWTNSANRLTCNDMATYGVQHEDGTYGIKLFYEARGYRVTECYNQRTDNVVSGGFSFADFKNEIDAGRPVMLHLVGHTIVGIGYDDSTSPETIYINDTWDHSTHTMPWGGSYSGMQLYLASIVNFKAQSAFGTYLLLL